jgi:hypothetical protein
MPEIEALARMLESREKQKSEAPLVISQAFALRICEEAWKVLYERDRARGELKRVT